jgi:endonuclease/exonuclease/phosphatase family metal-dependent hydrolase
MFFFCSAREVDETVAQKIEASMRNGILANEQNEAHHRLSRNLQRQAKAAQKVCKTNKVTAASKKINADIADLQEARRQSSAKEKALREELRAMEGTTTAPRATSTHARGRRNDESAVFSASSTGRVKPTATASGTTYSSHDHHI